jgi:hypothetical protein
MQNNQFYALMLALLALSTQPALGMMSPTRAQNVLDRDTILQELNREDAQVDNAAKELCKTALQETSRGTIYFNLPRYEKHLDHNPNIPWQALFMANAQMIRTLTQQPHANDEKDDAVKHMRCATIYCETARELLKRTLEGNPAGANIPALKNLAKHEYEEAYKDQPEKFSNAFHIAQHRWNECTCNKLYTAPLSRKK